MKPVLRLLFLVAAFAAAAASASAAEVLRTLPSTLDPAKAYALVEIRNHDGGSQAGNITLARYDAAGGDVRGGLRSPGSALARGVAVRLTVSRRPLARSDESRLYLLELEPDTWVIEGAGGTAFSLESRTFTIRAGEVLDLGVFSPRGDWPEGEGPPQLTAGRLAGIALLGPFARMPRPQPAMLEIRPRGDGDLDVPESLRGVVVPAEFSAGARFGNYLGGLVNRIDGRAGRPGAQQDAGQAQPD